MDFEKLLYTFPPPQFLDVPFTSIVFSDSHVRVLALEERTLHPLFFNEVELEPGIIEAGIIKKEDELIKVITEISIKFKTPFVKFAVPDEITYVFTARVPVFPGQDAKESVAFILEENVPLPLSDISFDFTPLAVEKEDDGFFASVVVTAMSASTMNKYTSLLRKANLEPIYSTCESQAIARSLISKNENGQSAILYAHRDTLGIYMTEGRVVEFSSIVQIPPDSSPDLFASFVIKEFSKAFEFWKEKTIGNEKRKNIDVVPVFLCGRHDVCFEIQKTMSRSSSFPVFIGNVWRNTFSLDDYIPSISFEDSLRFGGAVGLFV